MNAKIVILLGLVAMAAADSDVFRGYRAPRRSFESYESSEESYESSEAKYNFQWAVDHDPSSNEFGHQESRDGDNTKGSYYVQLPDGRLQQVTYYVDGYSGYIADVKYTGSASYESDESNESFRYYGSDSNESNEPFRYYGSDSYESDEPFRYYGSDSNESNEPFRYYGSDSNESNEPFRYYGSK